MQNGKSPASCPEFLAAEVNRAAWLRGPLGGSPVVLEQCHHRHSLICPAPFPLVILWLMVPEITVHGQLDLSL